MKKTISFILAGIIILAGIQTAVAEQAPQSVIDLGNSTLSAYGTDPVLVQAVKNENAKNKSLDQIKALDQQWINTPGIADFMKAVLDNETAQYLDAIQQKKPFYAEIFLMDNQGALVAATDKTSDYWQGDEDKFSHPFTTGSMLVSDVAFDTSAQAYLVQISVPVQDGDKIIGAITFGINLDEFE
jgi:C4-dicarboxylate-specific signal transduction histidine kinase